MKEKIQSITSHLLLYLLAADDVLTPWMNPYEARRRAMYGHRPSYRTTLYRLQKKGWLTIAGSKTSKFIKLTELGKMHALLFQAKLAPNEPWDGKWRLVTFDIPTSHNKERHFLRLLLKQNGFKQLQGSVYINPYPLNRSAIYYLQKNGLSDYIRVMKVEEMDNDADLRKHFGL